MRVLSRHWLFALLVFIVALAGACSFAPDLGNGAIACGVGGTCPPGYFCAVDGKCYLPGSGPGPIGVDGGDVVSVVSVEDISVQEGNEGTTDAVFTVKVAPPSTKEIRVDYATIDETAKAPADYTSATGTLVIPAGAATGTVTVKVTADRVVEEAEKFSLELKNPENATLGNPSKAACTITDDDTPGIAIDDATVVEGNAELSDMSFKVFLTKAYAEVVTVNYATANGTALEGSDFVSSADTVTFQPGETEKSIIVPIKGDTRHEVDKTFVVNLSNAVGAPLVDAQATGTIKDDDPVPSLTINDVAVMEDDSGTTTMTFEVKLSTASGELVKVDFATGGGTAAANDYAGTNGTLTFDPDVTTKTIAVQINGDTIDEPDETFNVVLSNPVGATLTKSTGVGTIENNDLPPAISIDDVALLEGAPGATPTMTFTLKLSGPSGKQVTVAWATENDSATAGSDFTAGSGTVTFAVGDTQKTINVALIGDAVDEGPERFFVNLSNPVNATIEKAQGIGTILNDDGVLPLVSISDVTVTEGNSGAVTATFNVTLSVGSSSPIAVTFETVNLTASAGTDYIAQNGTVSFAAFETSKPISITVNGDELYEATETFAVNLTGATNANIVDAQGIGTITNDDTEPTVSIADIVQVEGNSGTSAFAFPVTLSKPSAFQVTVNYTTANGTASSGSDYAATSSVLTFAPGETTKDVLVTVNGDQAYEDTETFTVTLSNPVNTTITKAVATGTITADDDPPVFTIDDVTKQEGNTGLTSFTFTVTKTGSTTKEANVTWATADDTAVQPSDYQANGATLTFLPAETTKTITVSVVTDTIPEGDEQFFVNLTNPVNATIGDAQGRGLIQNDDGAIRTLSINDRTVTEGSFGTVTVQFTVTLSPQINQQVTVDWATADGTAKAGADYVAANGTLVFNAGQTSKTITITVNHDTLDEDNETFFVNLSNPSANATILKGQGQGTITDNDPTPTLSVNNQTVTEGDGADKTVTFTITLSAASGRAVTVDYETVDGTAKSTGMGRDFVAVPTTTATFAPGETTKQVQVTIKSDNNDESTEQFTFVLSNPTNATILDGSGTCTINDDD